RSTGGPDAARPPALEPRGPSPSDLRWPRSLRLAPRELLLYGRMRPPVDLPPLQVHIRARYRLVVSRLEADVRGQRRVRALPGSGPRSRPGSGVRRRGDPLADLLPAISFGLWQNFGTERPLETSRAIVRRAFDLGITHFDLANNYGPPYGSAEESFGRLFAQDLRPFRDELVISTKAGYDMWPGPYGEWGSRKYLLASLDQSLARMGLECVDIFYSHRVDPDTPLEETMGALETALRHGKALYVGISSYSAKRTREAAA